MTTIPLGDICRFEYGKSLPDKARKLGGTAVYGSNGPVGSHEIGFTSGQTIIIGRKGSIGEIHLSYTSCWPIDTTYYIDESCTECDLEWLSYTLRHLNLGSLNKASGIPGLNRDDAYGQLIVFPKNKEKQRQIAAHLKAQLTEVEIARQAAQMQLKEITKLANSIVYDSVKDVVSEPIVLGNVLNEVKKGIGENWKDYPTLGATRDGLAPAKEQPGKHAPKYKPVFPGTVFYNPMRILIGSIAFVDEDDTPGITSPDYVALQGKEGVVDSRWFYYWLRSPLGEQCILSLARGAVRERMLFNRLAEGKIQLPSFVKQKKASLALNELRPLRRAVEQQLCEIDLLPQKILNQAFNPQGM